uniref:Uncharacterized protein n=1 Tax=uncultured bacterium fosmid pJB83B9 TaxID=1478070 RepID=A0A0H3UAM5_9BACT|nr:hypothetical protein [uncultured bacterium fosmid pJB83B9]
MLSLFFIVSSGILSVAAVHSGGFLAESLQSLGTTGGQRRIIINCINKNAEIARHERRVGADEAAPVEHDGVGDGLKGEGLLGYLLEEKHGTQAMSELMVLSLYFYDGLSHDRLPAATKLALMVASPVSPASMVSSLIKALPVILGNTVLLLAGVKPVDGMAPPACAADTASATRETDVPAITRLTRSSYSLVPDAADVPIRASTEASQSA